MNARFLGIDANDNIPYPPQSPSPRPVIGWNMVDW